MFWTHCWKCEKEIATQKDCNYLKIRDGDFHLCPECYKNFLEHNSEYIRQEKSLEIEIERSLYQAISNFHEKVIKEDRKLPRSYFSKIPPALIHKGTQCRDCPACIKILELIEKRSKE